MSLTIIFHCTTKVSEISKETNHFKFQVVQDSTFDLELLVDHRGRNSKSDLSCTIPRGKAPKLPETPRNS